MFVDIIQATDLGWLAADNDQQSYQQLSQTSNACVSAVAGHFEHIMWTR